MNKNKIYYWANNLNKNSGEGILANNFIELIKKNKRNIVLQKINNLKYKENIFSNYLLPYLGVLKIIFYHFRGFKTCYINYLPLWNFIIFLLLPKKTILGPITGNTLRKSTFFNICEKLSIFILKKKKKKLLFSHDRYKNFFGKKNMFYNFVFYGFKFKKKKLIKFDFIFYYRLKQSKGNRFIIELINLLSRKFKCLVIGEKLNDQFKKKKNILNYSKVSREFAKQLISQTKFTIATKENLFSYFVVDSLSFKNKIFYNKKFWIDKKFKQNLLYPICFDNLAQSYNLILKYYRKDIKKRYFKYKKVEFNKYLQK